MTLKPVLTDEELVQNKNHNDSNLYTCIANCKKIALYTATVLGVIIICSFLGTLVYYTLFLIHEYYSYLKEDNTRVIELLSKIFTHGFVSAPFIILWLKK